jgi:hypothetical protein
MPDEIPPESTDEFGRENLPTRRPDPQDLPTQLGSGEPEAGSEPIPQVGDFVEYWRSARTENALRPQTPSRRVGADHRISLRHKKIGGQCPPYGTSDSAERTLQSSRENETGARLADRIRELDSLRPRPTSRRP